MASRGRSFFFTVNLLQRQGNDLLTRHIDVLRSVVKSAQTRHPFRIHGWLVLPEQLHCVIELTVCETIFAVRRTSSPSSPAPRRAKDLDEAKAVAAKQRAKMPRRSLTARTRCPI